MQESIRSLNGGIGFIPASQLEQGMRMVEIDGIAPTDAAISSGEYPLWVDIKATSLEEPTGQIREFLGWLQQSRLTSQ
jgi:ABC-type phosphate transport system substrate-binding protein